MRMLRDQFLVLALSALLIPCAVARAQDDFDAEFEASGPPQRAVTTSAPVDDDPFGEPIVEPAETDEEEALERAAAAADSSTGEAKKRDRKKGAERITDDPDHDVARRRAFHRHGTIGGPV